MKRTILILSFLFAAALVAVIVLASRQRAELLSRNGELADRVKKLELELQAAGPHATWKSYANRELGFELRYPPELFSGQPPKASRVTARNGMRGVELSQEMSGCVLEVYVASSSPSSNPFDEAGVPENEHRYVASSRLTGGGRSYYVGMGVVSHAVDPRRTCIPAFNQILTTFRLIPDNASSAAAGGSGGASFRSVDPQSLRRLGVADPETAVRDSLAAHPELIPFHGVLGGTLAFHDPSSIVLLPGRWVYAPFDDGHVEGRLIAAWDVASDRTITWRLVAAECPGC